MDTLLPQIMDHLPVSIWMKDSAGRFVFVNKALCEQMNRPCDEWIGKTDIELWPRPFALHVMADDQVVIRSRQPLTLSEELPGGVWVETTKIPIVKDGEVVGTVGIARDITNEISMSENLRSSIARLERLMGEG